MYTFAAFLLLENNIKIEHENINGIKLTFTINYSLDIILKNKIYTVNYVRNNWFCLLYKNLLLKNMMSEIKY